MKYADIIEFLNIIYLIIHVYVIPTNITAKVSLRCETNCFHLHANQSKGMHSHFIYQ